MIAYFSRLLLLLPVGHWPLFVCAHVSSAECKCKCKWILCNNFHMNLSPKRKKESQAKQRKRISAYWWILRRAKIWYFSLVEHQNGTKCLNLISVNHQLRIHYTLFLFLCVYYNLLEPCTEAFQFRLSIKMRWCGAVLFMCVYFWTTFKDRDKNKIVHDKLHTPEILHEIHCPWNWLDFAVQCEL